MVDILLDHDSNGLADFVGMINVESIQSVLLFAYALVFFCLDYTYTSWVRDYIFLYAILDIPIILGMYLAMQLVNLGDPSLAPEYFTYSVIFTGIHLCFWIWDYKALRRNRQESNVVKRDFYMAMVKWERNATILCATASVLTWLGVLPFIVTSVAMGYTLYYFTKLLTYKRKLLNDPSISISW